MDGTISRYTLDPAVLFDIRWLWRCRIRILMVTDSGSGGFGPVAGFHLGEILNILAADPWPHVTFEVTRAHRQASPEADVIDSIRFDSHDLSVYDQVWLFGINRAGPDPLSDAELRAISQFMDAGGGVFATGDHENLGLALAGEVPRVRSMRRWYYPGPGPNGEPVAPAQTGAARHDTLVDPAGAPGPDQSDAVPQTIRPRWYTRFASSGIFLRRIRYPHPVLCGSMGVIDFLPDHMHEGLCEVPANLNQSFTFDGYTVTEYPTLAGHQQVPEVIAWADSHGTTATQFGVLAAYDGHRVNVGRVLVDATWHHWFNINLVGFVNATTPGHPTYDPAVVPRWEEIKAYFRNVGVWLARASKQNCIRNGGWLLVSRYYDILITYQPFKHVEDRLKYFWQVGVFARDALGRLAPQCQQVLWLADVLEGLELSLDPWKQLPQPEPEPDPWIDTDLVELVALGGAIDAVLHNTRDEKEAESLMERGGDQLHELARQGAARAVAELAERSRAGVAAMERLGERAAGMAR
jgi:hypothetical protein